MPSLFSAGRFPLMLAALLGLLTPSVHATSCLVIGERTARLSSSEGERSPVFHAPQCESLRLISGKAQASWVGRDGKPRIMPIGPDGPQAMPTAGAEERSGNVVWAELTSKREAQRPAYMRAFGDERPPRVYMPEEGLVLVAKAEVPTELSVSRLQGDAEQSVSRVQIEVGNPVRLERKQFQAGELYLVQIKRGEIVEQWKWRMLSAEESQRLQQHLQEVAAAVPSDTQQLLLQAMVFEQLKLRTNMELTLQSLR